MEFLHLMPTLIRRKFVPPLPLVLLLLIPLISLGDFSSGHVSTNTEEKAKTEVHPYVTTCLNFTTAIIDKIIPNYVKSFLNYATEEVVPFIKNFEEEVKKKIISDFNLNFTGEALFKEVIPSVKSFLYSAQEKANKEVVPIVISFLSSSNEKLNTEVIPYVKSCLNSTMGIVREEVIPTVKSFLLSMKEKMNEEVIPCSKRYLTFSKEIIQNEVSYQRNKLQDEVLSMKEKMNEEFIPYVKSCLNSTMGIVQEELIPFIKRFSYSAVDKVFNEAIRAVSACLYIQAEIVQKSFHSLKIVAIFVGICCKEHPRLFLVVVLIICCVRRLSLALFPTKMMKAPGRNYKIPREDFERNPGSYFKRQREIQKQKKSK